MYYDYIIKYRVLLSQPSGQMFENGFFPFSLTSLPFLGGVGFSPGLLRCLAGAGGFYFLNFLWVGE